MAFLCDSKTIKIALFSATFGGMSVLGAGTALAETAVLAPDALAEVVVTARKRSENIQDVAASVTVEQGVLLQARNQSQLTDYAINIPGLNVANLGKAGLSAISIRGIASVSAGASVAAYVDETPIGSSGLFNYGANTIFDLLPYDLDRLEVLRGPQGTLYGAGSLGGLIKYVLKPADTGAFSAVFGADVDVTDGADRFGHSIRGMVNVPIISDKFAVRISAYDRQQPGYIDNVWPGASAKNVNTERQRGGRVALFWQAAPTLSVKSDFYHTQIDTDDGGVVSYAEVAQTGSGDAKIVRIGSPYGQLTQNHAFPQRLKKDVTLYATVVNWDASFALVTSATSYAEQDIKLSADQSLAVRPFGFLFGVPGALARSDSDLGLTKFTQEIRIASPTSSNNPQWVVGAFFTDEKSKSGNDIGLYKPDFTLAPNLNPFLTTDLPTGYKEYAAFGDITVRIVETMSLSGGIRLAKNEQSWVQTSGGAFAGPSAGTLTAPSNNESIATWSAAARYQPTSKIMVYGRIATGYRPGGPNAPTPGAPLSVRSDNLINYELGIKSDLFEDRIRINATVFIVDWDDVQLNAVRGGFSYLGNGGKAKTEGLEFSASWLPVVGLTLTSNLAYTKSELTSVTTESNFVEGYQLPGVPKVTASFNADYAWVPAQGWDAAVGGNWRYVGEQWLTGVQRGASAAPAIRAPSYQMVNLYASVTRGDLSFKIFGNNITNKRAQQGGIALIDLGNNPVQGDIYISKPRTVGFGVDVKFN